MVNPNLPPMSSYPGSSGPSTQLVVWILVLTPALAAGGVVSWVNGREAGFGLIVVAIAILFGCERIAAAIRRR